jgi:hypothetical protein
VEAGCVAGRAANARPQSFAELLDRDPDSQGLRLYPEDLDAGVVSGNVIPGVDATSKIVTPATLLVAKRPPQRGAGVAKHGTLVR